MKIQISDNKTIFSIQEEFHAAFPYLKLEFFSKLHKPGAVSAKQLIRPSDKKLGDCRSIHKKGLITIRPEMTVADLEQQFGRIYGLGVQVFRRSGKAWLETTVTDGWTLKEQNQQGEALSKPFM